MKHLPTLTVICLAAACFVAAHAEYANIGTGDDWAPVGACSAPIDELTFFPRFARHGDTKLYAGDSKVHTTGPEDNIGGDWRQKGSRVHFTFARFKDGVSRITSGRFDGKVSVAGDRLEGVFLWTEDAGPQKLTARCTFGDSGG